MKWWLITGAKFAGQTPIFYSDRSVALVLLGVAMNTAQSGGVQLYEWGSGTWQPSGGGA